MSPHSLSTRSLSMDLQSGFSSQSPHSAKRSIKILTLLCALGTFVTVTAPLPAFAQGNTISGVVLDRNQVPLENAQVTVRGTSLGGQTDANGRFRISGIAGTTATLDIRRLGYRATSATASVGAETRISMEPAASTWMLSSSLDNRAAPIDAPLASTSPKSTRQALPPRPRSTTSRT